MAKDIPKLTAEKDELGCLIYDLGALMESLEFDTLSREERALIQFQYEGMNDYYEALKDRINLG